MRYAVRSGLPESPTIAHVSQSSSIDETASGSCHEVLIAAKLLLGCLEQVPLYASGFFVYPPSIRTSLFFE
jgi:hypothetical protein